MNDTKSPLQAYQEVVEFVDHVRSNIKQELITPQNSLQVKVEVEYSPLTRKTLMVLRWYLNGDERDTIIELDTLALSESTAEQVKTAAQIGAQKALETLQYDLACSISEFLFKMGFGRG